MQVLRPLIDPGSIFIDIHARGMTRSRRSSAQRALTMELDDVGTHSRIGERAAISRPTPRPGANAGWGGVPWVIQRPYV
jgi:hypothetical protein